MTPSRGRHGTEGRNQELMNMQRERTMSRLTGVLLVMAVQVMALGGAGAQTVPAVLKQYLLPDTLTKGEVIVVLPPREIQKYIKKVEDSAEEHEEWFREYSKKSKPGVPLAFHENLGLTKDEYAEYIDLWKKREFKAVPNGKVVIRLEQPKPGEWMIRVTGEGSPISLLRYIEPKDQVKSPNGEMERIADIDADPMSILGAWSGPEWKFQEETSLGKTKENFSIGKLADGKTGLLVYRLQEVSSTGRLLYDKSLVVRFGLPAK